MWARSPCGKAEARITAIGPRSADYEEKTLRRPVVPASCKRM